MVKIDQSSKNGLMIVLRGLFSACECTHATTYYYLLALRPPLYRLELWKLIKASLILELLSLSVIGFTILYFDILKKHGI